MKPYTYIPRKPWDSKSCRFFFLFLWPCLEACRIFVFPLGIKPTPQHWTGKELPKSDRFKRKEETKASFHAKRLSGKWKTNDKRGKNIHNSHYHLLSYLTMSLVVTTINQERTKWFRREREKRYEQGLPWWLSGKESSCQYRKHGLNPWSGKIPKVLEQLSLCASTLQPVLQSLGSATPEPTHHSYWSPQALGSKLLNKRSHHNEKTTHCKQRVAPAVWN